MVMSLYHLFSSSSNKPFLPDPAQEKTKEKELEVTNANTRVLEAMESQLRRKRPRGSYTDYSPELRAKIGKFPAESGNKAAIEKFFKEVGKPVSKSTVRDLKKHYYEAFKQNWTGEPVSQLNHGLRGRPLKLGDLDSNVQDYIRNLRLSGGVVNRAIVIATAKGLHCCVNAQFNWERNGQILCYRG
jgi:hypothetical protein